MERRRARIQSIYKKCISVVPCSNIMRTLEEYLEDDFNLLCRYAIEEGISTTASELREKIIDKDEFYNIVDAHRYWMKDKDMGDKAIFPKDGYILGVTIDLDDLQGAVIESPIIGATILNYDANKQLLKGGLHYCICPPSKELNSSLR